MRCSKCGTEGICGKRFCADCGGPLSNCCSKCNSDNALSARFCADCGSALSNDVGAEALVTPIRLSRAGTEALALAQKLSHPFSLVFAQNIGVGILRQLRREARVVHEIADSAIALSVEHGLADPLAYATVLRGWAISEQGRNQEGIAQILQGLAGSRATGAEVLRPYLLCLLAEVYRDAGHFGEGLSALREALAAAGTHQNRAFEAEIHRLTGELLLRQNDSNATEAQRCFQGAIEIARKQSAKSLELRAAMSLARLLDNTGRRDEARAMLADIYGWFSEGFDTADLKDAKALLAELGN
jgi:predicted ATPase